MVQRSPPLTQITVIHHHHGNNYRYAQSWYKLICLDEEERLLQMSYNKNSPLSDAPESLTATVATVSTLNFDDEKQYRTVSVTKDGGHLGFSVKVICYTLLNKDCVIM